MSGEGDGIPSTSIKFTNKYPEPLTFTNTNLVPAKTLNLTKPRPRRRLADSDADGLDILIQKTKAIGLRQGEEGLVCIILSFICRKGVN